MAPVSAETQNRLEKLKAVFVQQGQGHVFDHVDKLKGDEEVAALLSDLEAIDLDDLRRNFELVSKSEGGGAIDSSHLAPFPSVCGVEGTEEERKKWKEAGYDLLAQGKAAVLLLAGGQGTRLGTAAPKGEYDIGMPSGKSLFQMQAERLRMTEIIVSKRAGKDVRIPLYIMCSDATANNTKKFFREHGYFGLDKDHVFFFEQDTLPCITPKGKIIMESTGKVSRAPNGNGGMYQALDNSGALRNMEERGVHYLSQYCVDNSLVKMADPVFFGFCAAKNADCGAKVLPKLHPDEKVGVLCLRDGGAGVIEYSEIDPELSRSVDPASKELRFNAAHICMNMFSVPFLKKIAKETIKSIPYHIAKKKIPCVDEHGETQTPADINGWKLEQFIFDVFDKAEHMVALEVSRDSEFSPLKNGPGAGSDCPETCRVHLSALHKKYAKLAGASFEGEGLFEISPTLSISGEGLEEHVRGKTFKLPYELK